MFLRIDKESRAMAEYRITGIATYRYYIRLNPIMGKMEDIQHVGEFNTMEEALAFYNGEKVEPYQELGPDHYDPIAGTTKMYLKHFKKGGPLEWCNPLLPPEFNIPGRFGHGIVEDVVNVRDILRVGPSCG